MAEIVMSVVVKAVSLEVMWYFAHRLGKSPAGLSAATYLNFAGIAQILGSCLGECMCLSVARPIVSLGTEFAPSLVHCLNSIRINFTRSCSAAVERRRSHSTQVSLYKYWRD